MHVSNSVNMLTLIKIRTFLSPQRRPGISQSERRPKTDKREMSLESSGKKVSSDGMHTPEVAAPPKELQPGLGRWRQWNSHRRPMVSDSFIGRSLPEDTEGWVHLQFHAEQA
ncbi:Hypothetical predicted protein [Lynx pardinus]|uniref:Uncharacterized protein n=1 Tax=Lynx pardinus TaxID=191816 RepID=A0A485MT73_LYNPA|nr:Hypothetical predicted protein [Lynx pardinus]